MTDVPLRRIIEAELKLHQFADAVANVLKRKRSEHLRVSLQMALCLEKREAPPKGLGSEIDSLARQIRILENAIAEICSPSGHVDR